MLELSHAFTLLYIKVSSFYISSFKYKHISVFIDIIYIFILGKKRFDTDVNFFPQ